MKRFISLPILAGAAGLCLLGLPVHAQGPNVPSGDGDSVGPPRSAPAERGVRGPRGQRQPMLSAEERETLQAARQTALADPEVQAARDELGQGREARQEFRELMHQKMLEADPTIEPILQKLGDGLRRHGKLRRMRGAGLADLSEQERETLKETRLSVKDDAEVAAARDALQGAEEPDAKKEAAASLRDAIHQAMVEANPEVAAIIEKMEASREDRRANGPGPGNGPGARN